MKKILRITGLIFALAILFGAILSGVIYKSIENRINKRYGGFSPQPLTITGDSIQRLEGARLAIARGCPDCHGKDFSGKVVIDDPAIGLIVGSNLTKGQGGLPSDYSMDDWTRSLMHGVNRKGKSLWLMPSHEFNRLSIGDMSAIVAFMQSIPKVDKTWPPQKIGLMGRALTFINEFPLLTAEWIDHSQPLANDLTPSATAEYGKYLSVSCSGCHRQDMKGGDPVAPGFPPVLDISRSGAAGRWTIGQFINALRTGVTPEGKKLNQQEMPWNTTAAWTDTELMALYSYLNSI